METRNLYFTLLNFFLFTNSILLICILIIFLTSKSVTYSIQSDSLNGKLPIVIFEGSRAINSSDIWNSEYSFSNFKKIEMHILFQSKPNVLTFYTKNSDDMMQQIGFTSYNGEDSGKRIIVGQLKFSGRYISAVNLFMSLNLSPFTSLPAESITVQKILGYF